MEPPEIAPVLQQIQQSTSVDLSPTLQELPGINADGHRYPTRYSLSKKSYSMACISKYAYATEQLAKKNSAFHTFQRTYGLSSY